MSRGEYKALQFSDGVEVTPATEAPLGRSYELASAWNGTEETKTYDLTAADDNGNTVGNARNMIWMFKDISANNYAQLTGMVIDHPAIAQVRVTFGAGYPPAAGTYLLVGR